MVDIPMMAHPEMAVMEVLAVVGRLEQREAKAQVMRVDFHRLKVMTAAAVLLAVMPVVAVVAGVQLVVMEVEVILVVQVVPVL